MAAVLGESHPCNDLAVLLASELVTNSVRYSGSAVPGGLVTVAVTAGGGGAMASLAPPHLELDISAPLADGQSGR